MRRVAVLIAILLAPAMLVACGKDSNPATGDAGDPAPSTQPATTATTPASTKKSATTATTPASTKKSATTTTKAPRSPATPKVKPRSTHDGCQAVAAPSSPADPLRTRSRSKLRADRVYTLVVRTNCGTMTIRLSSVSWPTTTSAFAGLVRGKFFDGLTFHRIAKPGGNDYVIQGGDPFGNGNGGPGYSVVETPPSTTKYPRYTVAMAKSQDERRGTSGSQFFIVTAKVAPIPPDYAVLGNVTGGQNVVRRIARVATDPATEMPIDPVVISSVRLRSSPR